MLQQPSSRISSSASKRLVKSKSRLQWVMANSVGGAVGLALIQPTSALILKRIAEFGVLNEGFIGQRIEKC